jgi:16S rRNA (guanine1207-N2)-methyltransferase
MSSDHYFSQEPKSEYQPKQIELDVAGEVFKVSTASGTFSPLRLDVGTSVLIDHLELAPKDGNVLDLGCGWGPIALNLAKHSPKAEIWAVDVNNRSLELTAENAKTVGLTNIQTATPDTVPEEIMFSGIWSNPPIRIGKKELHELLLTWLPRLEKNASAYLVVQKNLGSDSLQKWLTETLIDVYEVSRLTSVKTYRIIKVLRTS